jgi:hypothetical protein
MNLIQSHLYLVVDMLRSAWNQKGQLLSDLFRKKAKPPRDQHPPGPSNLSIIQNADHSDTISEVESINRQANQSPVLPDTVALVQTPDQLEDSPLETSPEEDHPAMDRTPASSQQSLELPAESRKSGRMNRLITKLRNPRV